MPKYRVTSPDGRTFDVDAPTGVTADQVMTFVQQQAEQQPTAGPTKIGMEAFPETFRQEFNAAPEGDQMLAAFGSPVLSIGERIRQILPGLTADKANIAATRVMAQERPLSAAAGTAAAFAPTAAIRGANTMLGSALIGGGIGFMQPADGITDTAINTAGGALGGAIGQLAGRTLAAGGKAAVAFKDPFFQSGQEKIAGRTLDRFAGDKAAAAANMAGARQLVPGSMPTAGEVSGDAGIAQLQRALIALDPQVAADFTARRLVQDTARLNVLRNMSGTELDRELMRAVRDYMSAPLYESAISKGVDQKMAAALKPQIDSLLGRPSIKTAMSKAKDLAAEQGMQLDDMGSVAGLHYIKMALDDMLGTAQTSGLGKTAQRAITQTKGDLLSVIDDLSPDYKSARSAFASWSKPINQMEVAQFLREKLQSSLAEAGASTRLRASTFADAVRDSAGTTVKRATGFGRSELDDVMRPEQMDMINNLVRDLARRANADELGRSAGSNTAQNLASQNMLAQIAGPAGIPQSWTESTLLQSILRPLQWTAKLGEGRVQRTLGNALLDPQQAAALMMRVRGPSWADVAGGKVAPFLPGVGAGSALSYWPQE